MSFRGSYIRAAALIGLREIVEPHGATLETYLNELQIDPAALRDVDMLISFRQYSALLELLATRLPLPFIGLELTKRSPPEFPILGPLVMLANLVEDLDAFIAAGLNYWPLHTNGQTITVQKLPAQGIAVMRHVSDPFSLPARQLNELAISIQCAVARTVTTQHLNPEVVRFQHRKPEGDGPYQELFGCPVEFGAEHNEVVFDIEYLKFKTKGRLKFLRPLVHYYIGLRMDLMKINDRSLATAVALIIPTVFGMGQCNANFIASALNMSSKMLQRQLASEGTSFSQILDAVRRKMATQMLVESDAPVGRIAHLLDYASSGPFTTAFRRWEGTAPLAYRKAKQTGSG